MPSPVTVVKRISRGKPTKNGNFNIRAPRIPKLPYLNRPERMLLVLSAAPSVAAKEFGVNRSTIREWRTKIQTLGKERPSIWTDLGFSANAIKMTKQFYDHGGNWLRHNYRLTKAGTDGLLITLAIQGYIKSSREQYIADVASVALKQKQFSRVTRKEFTKWVMGRFNVKEPYVREILEKITVSNHFVGE